MHRQRRHERVEHTTPQKRAAEFPDVVVRQIKGKDQMWCKYCRQHVNHLEKTYAVENIGSESHERHKKEMSAAHLVPGQVQELWCLHLWTVLPRRHLNLFSGTTKLPGPFFR